MILLQIHPAIRFRVAENILRDRAANNRVYKALRRFQGLIVCPTPEGAQYVHRPVNS
jgi:hypothetical protein